MKTEDYVDGYYGNNTYKLLSKILSILYDKKKITTTEYPYYLNELNINFKKNGKIYGRIKTKLFKFLINLYLDYNKKEKYNPVINPKEAEEIKFKNKKSSLNFGLRVLGNLEKFLEKK